ncbi:hypothetical protein M758_12G138600 [Ceratodon purpureus]|nr:hypothetical protein M758_12G138600 [Ceratodon purpureus]
MLLRQGSKRKKQGCLINRHVQWKAQACSRCPPACPRSSMAGVPPECPPTGQRYRGTFDVMRRVVNEEGFLRLWRGLNASLAISIPTVGIYLPCYDLLREELVLYSEENSLELKPYAPLLAGSIARSVAVVVCSPLELAKTRMQAQVDPRTGKLPGVLAVLRSVNNIARNQDNVDGRGSTIGPGCSILCYLLERPRACAEFCSRSCRLCPRYRKGAGSEFRSRYVCRWSCSSCYLSP